MQSRSRPTTCWGGVPTVPSTGPPPATALRMDRLGEVSALFSPESVDDSPRRHDDIAVRDRLIAGHVPGEPAPLGEPHGQEVLPTNHLGVVDRAVAGEAADAVEYLAGLQVPLRHGHDVADGLAL